jgi:hypothetical protein
MNYKKKADWILTIIFFVLMATVCLSQQSAAIMLPLSTENLTRESELIISGDVKQVKSEWGEDKKSIFTFATVTVRETIKGKASDKTLKIMYEGGEIDGIGMKVSDVAIPNVGENVLLFLKPAKTRQLETIYKNVGKAQGQYKIDKDGIARKSGYNVEGSAKDIDNTLPIEVLIEKIKRIGNEKK